MLSFRLTVVAVCVCALGLACPKAFAAGAYSVETPDAAAFGMGSAFAGEADDPAAIYYNPAGINQMTSPEVSLGDSILAPRGHMESSFQGAPSAGLSSSNGDIVHYQNNEYNIPNFYFVAPINNKLSVGAGGGSDWGLGFNWGPNSPLQYAVEHVNISDVDNSLVVSYKVTPQWSIAASADNDYSRESLTYALNNATPLTMFPNGQIELRGSDDAWGYRLATMYKINDQNQVGLMYRSRIDHDYTGKVSINGIDTSVYSAFSPSYVGNVSEKSVLPQSVRFGYSYKPTSKWTINLDAEWMDWSSTKYQTFTFTGTPAQVAILNMNNHIPENWHSAWSESIGTQYDVTDRFRVRLGYYHHQQVVPDADFNPELPDSDSNGYTGGFGLDLTNRLTLDVAYGAMFFGSRSVVNSVAAVSAGAPGTVDGKYSQFINIGLVSLTYKF